MDILNVSVRAFYAGWPSALSAIVFSPTPSSWHDDSCAELAGVWSLPIVKGKTWLNVLVMFTPQFHSVGPQSFNPKYVWGYHGLIVGFDPVACDSLGLRVIEAKRRAFFGGERPLAPPAEHITLAVAFNISQPEDVDINEILFRPTC